MENLATVAGTLFSSVWNFFLQVDFPGTDISMAAFAVSLMIISGSIKLFSYLTGFRVGTGYGAAADSAQKAKSAIDRDRAGKNQLRMDGW